MLEVLDFVFKKDDRETISKIGGGVQSGSHDERARLAEMLLYEVARDPDLTMCSFNMPNKRLNLDLRHLFPPAKMTFVYDGILSSLLKHLKQNTDPTIQVTGSFNVIETILEVAPNCNKQLVAMIFSELQRMMLDQYDSHFLELYTKESMIMGLQHHLHNTTGYAEADKLAMLTSGYQL